MSHDIRTFDERMRAAAARLPYFRKDARNAHHKYNYVSEAKVKRDVRKALEAEGLRIGGVETLALPGSTANNAVVSVRVVIVDAHGNREFFDGVGGDADKSGKAVMKAEAAALKYALVNMFLIPTGDDPEANEEADELGDEDEPAPKRKRDDW